MGHVDERHVYGEARDMIEEGDPNPHFFRYPSLPIYLTAGTVLVSNAVWGNDAPDGRPVFEVPRQPGQTYQPERVIRHTRLVFGALGGMTFFWVALLSFRTAGSVAWAFCAPLMLALSGIMQNQVVRYQNVDSPTVFFALLTLVVALHHFGRESLWGTAIFPGFLAGLTTACKYNSGLVLIPCALAIVLAPGTGRKPLRLFLLGAAAAVAFFVAVPYALFDFDTFRADVIYEIEHYKNGHPGKEAEPGLEQLTYYLTVIQRDFGVVICALSLVGMGTALRRFPREALVVLSFPLLMLLHMSTNRTHFPRTILPVFALVPVFATWGAWSLARGARWALERGGAAKIRPWMPRVFSAALTVVALAISLPASAETARLFERNIEAATRDQAIAWVRDHIPSGSTVALSDDLWIRAEDFSGYRVVRISPGFRNAPEHLSKSSGTMVILSPIYGKPKHVPPNLRKNAKKRAAYFERAKKNAHAAIQIQKKTFSGLSAERLHRISGEKVAQTGSPKAKAAPIERPAIDIYVVD